MLVVETPSPKVDVSNMVNCFDWTPIFEWYVVRCDSKNGYQKDVIKRYCVMCSKYDKHSRFNNHHNWRDLYDHLMSTRILTLIMNKISI